MHSRICSYILALCFIFTCNSVEGRQVGSRYISSSEGSDSNDGLSASNPVANISAALSKADTLYLKAGDIFYGGVNFTGKYVTRYGDGPDPIICGFIRVDSPNWIEVEKNIWKISLTEDIYSGVKASNYALKNIGCIYDYENDIIHGYKVQHRSELIANWDFWQTDKFAKEDITDSTFDAIYLRLDEDPNLLNLEFSTGTSGVSLSDGCVSHISIRGFGRHGIAAGSNAEILYCSIDIIGGCTQIGYKTYTSLGNGIEFYVSKNISNSIVRGCEVSRCYDCGITIQGSGRTSAAPSNIIIEDNYIHDCCQGWEDFLRNGEDDLFNNCIFQNNIVCNNGDRTGFGYPSSRFKFCQVLGNNFSGDRGMIIRNNTFINGNYYCSGPYKNKYTSNVWDNNICYIMRGQFILSNYVGTKDVIRIPTEKGQFSTLKEATDSAIAQYRELTGDETTEFIIVKERKAKRLARRAVSNWR